MHNFIYASKDAWISSGSNKTTLQDEKDQNFGQDPILELKKVFDNRSFDYPTRVLVHFSTSDIVSVSESIAKHAALNSTTIEPKYYLRLYEAEGNKELSSEYKLQAFPISQSWDEGVGKFGDNPKTTTGVSWLNRNYPVEATETSWSLSDGSPVGGCSYISGSLFGEDVPMLWATQSFSYESPDINMDVTRIVEHWLTASNSNMYIPNNGILLKFSGSNENANLTFASSSETDNLTHGSLKFFSSQTHTIYAPKLEVRWDDHIPITGDVTGSLIELNLSSSQDNDLHMIRLKPSYKETETAKFRVRGRKKYMQKSFSTSLNKHSGSFIPEGSGSYSIIDVTTGETVVPFSDYTKLSCDSTSNYFNQDLNGFIPNRVYKIIYKLQTTEDGTQIFDNNFEFKIKR